MYSIHYYSQQRKLNKKRKSRLLSLVQKRKLFDKLEVIKQESSWNKKRSKTKSLLFERTSNAL